MLILPPTNPAGLTVYQIVENDGTVHDLSWQNNQRLFIPAGSVSLGGMTNEIVSNKLPVTPGTFARRVNTAARTMHIPIVIDEISYSYLLSVAEDLQEWFDTGDETQKRPAYFRVTKPNGDQRQIAFYYVNGLEGDMGEGSPTFVKYVVECYCPDPAPTDIADTTITKTVAEAASFGVINQGRLNAYPRWQIHGPFVNCNFANVTTGGALSIIDELDSSETLYVDTRPGDERNSLAVYKYDGVTFTNMADKVYPTSQMWQLISGLNTINVTFTSGTTSDTTVQLDYLARYRGILR